MPVHFVIGCDDFEEEAQQGEEHQVNNSTNGPLRFLLKVPLTLNELIGRFSESEAALLDAYQDVANVGHKKE